MQCPLTVAGKDLPSLELNLSGPESNLSGMQLGLFILKGIFSVYSLLMI